MGNQTGLLCNSCRQPERAIGRFADDQLGQDGVPQSDEDRERFIREFDYSRYLVRAGKDAEVDRELLKREVVRFMTLSLHGVSFELCSPLVDDVWHEMILDTPAYFDYCRYAFGVYLHHVSGSTSYTELHEDNHQEMLDNYERLFGELPPSELWDIELLQSVN